MEKKSSVQDVHKIINQDYPELYKTLCKKLQDKNPFAKFSTGAGFYVWSDNDSQWRCMEDASELKKSEVEDALVQTKNDIASLIGQKTTEALFTTPDNSYIYYTDEDGDIRIMLTGWGFKKPVRVSGRRDTTDIPIDNMVSISFSYDGERVPHYEFGLRLKRQVKTLQTDATGIFTTKMNVGESYTLTDLASNKDFTLNIIEGRNHYDYDITKYATLTIGASIEGSPVTGEKATVNYHGRDYDVTTDGNGQAKVKVPLHAGETASATMRDQTQSTTMTETGGEILFRFEPEKKEVAIEVVVMKDGMPVPNCPIAISYGTGVIDAYTDQNGTLHQQIEEVPNAVCTVYADGYDQQARVLSADQQNTFRFEKTTPPDPPEPPVPPVPPVTEKKDVKVMFRDMQNKPIVCQQVKFVQEGRPDLIVQLDQQGDTTFPEDTFEVGKPIAVTIEGWGDKDLSPISFTLDPDEYEYLIQEKESQQESIWWKILLEILAVLVAIVTFFFLWPYLEAFFLGLFFLLYN